MASTASFAAAALLCGGGVFAAGDALAQISGVHESWTVSNHTTDRYEGIYGRPVWVSLEEILRGNAPLAGAIRTRGYLRVDVRRGAGQGAAYRLALGTISTAGGLEAGLGIMPALSVRHEFDFEAESLKLREIEVVGTFEAGVGEDTHSVSGFWFWSYAGPPDPGGGRVAASCGSLTVADLVRSAAGGERRSVKVCGQFRGRNLFGDLEGDAPQPDAWVIRDGGTALWVTGKAPRGDGFALDLGSRGDAKH
jgi:hypothetical protein